MSLTVADNISANDECDKDMLNSALDKANIKDRIEAMPQKEKTYLYKDLDNSGVEISGGEAQKLALARAVYKNSPIVILDEATAYTDPENEAVIQSSVAKLVAGKTLIVIAHRLSTITDADKIFVIDDGRVCEQGTHKELLEDNGLYKQMWQAHISVKDNGGDINA